MSSCLPRLLFTAALVPLLALALPAQADALRVESSGVYTPDTPVTPFSAPGAAWSLTFVLDRNPTPVPDENMTFPGALVTVPFSDFQMLVDGVPTAQPGFVILYHGAEGGGMDVIFGGIQLEPVYRFDSLGTFGAAYYSGSELAPTIEPGSYATFHPDHAGLYVGYDNVRYYQPERMVHISAVPMPGSAALMLCGLVALPGLVRGWRKA